MCRYVRTSSLLRRLWVAYLRCSRTYLRNGRTWSHPPGLEVYHSTVRSFYQEWRSAKGDIDKVPGESLVAVKSAVRAVIDKHPDFSNLLIRSGCTG